MGAFATFAMKMIVDRTPIAVNYVEEQIFSKLHDEITNYYADYSPKLYIRTGLLSAAPEKKPAVISGNGAKGDVHMNNCKYPTGTWDRFTVIDAADHFTHGGYPVGGGVSVWEKPIETLEAHQGYLWHSALSAAGIL